MIIAAMSFSFAKGSASSGSGLGSYHSTSDPDEGASLYSMTQARGRPAAPRWCDRLLAERDAVELIEHSAVEALADAVTWHDGPGALMFS